MPQILSKFKPSYLFKHPHIATIAPNIFRYLPQAAYKRISIPTPDNDFIDLDTVCSNQPTALVVLHGLEGSCDRPYMLGITHIAQNSSCDVFAIHHRGCSGRPNLSEQAYHSGKTDDLHCVLNYITDNYDYKNIILLGFSLGGNIVLKYLGQNEFIYPKNLKAAIAISVPCNLKSAAMQLQNGFNKVYRNRFMKTLKQKAIEKKNTHPNLDIDLKKLNEARSFLQFDDLFTAPVHGFRDAEHYWEQSSSKQYINGIEVPTLLINAENDPFLVPECFPIEEAESNKQFYLEIPAHGGHVGFVKNWLELQRKEPIYSEKRAFDFIKEKVLG